MIKIEKDHIGYFITKDEKKIQIVYKKDAEYYFVVEKEITTKFNLKGEILSAHFINDSAKYKKFLDICYYSNTYLESNRDCYPCPLVSVCKCFLNKYQIKEIIENVSPELQGSIGKNGE